MIDADKKQLAHTEAELHKLHYEIARIKRLLLLAYPYVCASAYAKQWLIDQLEMEVSK